MSERTRWSTEEYRGIYVHAIAFEIAELGRMEPPPGQKWGYMIAIRYTADRDDDMIYGPAGDGSDYFTRAAAEQAALWYNSHRLHSALGYRSPQEFEKLPVNGMNPALHRAYTALSQGENPST